MDNSSYPVSIHPAPPHRQAPQMHNKPAATQTHIQTHRPASHRLTSTEDQTHRSAWGNTHLGRADTHTDINTHRHTHRQTGTSRRTQIRSSELDTPTDGEFCPGPTCVHGTPLGKGEPVRLPTPSWALRLGVVSEGRVRMLKKGDTQQGISNNSGPVHPSPPAGVPCFPGPGPRPVHPDPCSPAPQ